MSEQPIEAELESLRNRIGTIWAVQRRHGNRLDEIQVSLDALVGRLDRLKRGQQRVEAQLGTILEQLSR